MQRRRRPDQQLVQLGRLGACLRDEPEHDPEAADRPGLLRDCEARAAVRLQQLPDRACEPVELSERLDGNHVRPEGARQRHHPQHEHLGVTDGGLAHIDFGQLVSRSGSGHAANSFDCRYYDSSGNLIGRLAFNYPASGSEGSGNPGNLTIYGTVFIDGNIDLSGNDYIEYQGVGTIYVNGTVTLEAGAVLCAVPISGSPCLGNFDTTLNMLELVAINAGNAADGWTMTGSSNYEGIAFLNGNFNGGERLLINGSVIADTGTFSGANALMDTFSAPINSPGAQATTTTTTTTGGPDQVTFAEKPGTWQQLQ